MRHFRIHYQRARQDRAGNQDCQQREGRRNGAKLLRKFYDTAIRFARKYLQKVGYNSCSACGCGEIGRRAGFRFQNRTSRHGKRPVNLDPPVRASKCTDPLFPSLDQRICDDLDSLLHTIGLKAAA
jgi:hypothetical protein